MDRNALLTGPFDTRLRQGAAQGPVRGLGLAAGVGQGGLKT